MSNLNWNQVRADFSDTNQSMATGSGALSHAGTVFGQLRKSILDEEQRAIDNAYREKKFEEDVRQFGLNYALNKDKFAEDVRHNKAGEELTREGHEVQRRGQDLNYKAHMASIAEHRNNRLDANQRLEQIAQERKRAYDFFTDADLPQRQAEWDKRRTEAEQNFGAMQADLESRANRIQQIEGMLNQPNPVNIYATGVSDPTKSVLEREREWQDGVEATRKDLEAERDYLTYTLQRDSTELDAQRKQWDADNPKPQSRAAQFGTDPMTRAMIYSKIAPHDPNNPFMTLAANAQTAENKALVDKDKRDFDAQQKEKDRQNKLAVANLKNLNKTTFTDFYKSQNLDKSYIGPMADLANAVKSYAQKENIPVTKEDITSILNQALQIERAFDWGGVFHEEMEPHSLYVSDIRKLIDEGIATSNSDVARKIREQLLQRLANTKN